MSRKEIGVDIGKQRRVIEVTPLEMPEELSRVVEGLNEIVGD